MTTSQLILNLSLNIIGSLIGVVVGVWFARYELSKSQVLKKQDLRRKLIESLKFNITRLEQMHGQLTSEKHEVPDYRLDTESVAHILFHGRELFDDESWFDKFNWQRFQLVHINAKVDYLNDAINLSILHPSSIFATDGVARQRYVSLVGHVKTTQKEISDLIVAYEKAA